MLLPMNPDEIQREAIVRAKTAVSNLPHDNELFQQCLTGQITLQTVFATLEQQAEKHKRKSSTKVLAGFYRYTSWLNSISKPIDIAVNSSSGIACPVWASIKFILLVSKANAAATEQILGVIETIAENLPRLELYGQFHDNREFQVALINLFTSITEFSFAAYTFFKRRTYMRVGRLLGRNFDEEFGSVVSALKRKTRVVDDTAQALHQQRMHQHVHQNKSQRDQENRIKAMQWLQPANIREQLDRNVSLIADGTCEWIISHPKFCSWRSQQSVAHGEGCLIIHGPAGCGKSVICSYIHDMLAGSPLESSGIKEEETQGKCLFFSFSSSEASRQTPASLWKTLLAQLCELDDETNKILDLVLSLMGKSSVSSKDLLETVIEAIRRIPTPISIVIDGVDESSDHSDKFLRELLNLSKRISSLKTIISGQSHCFTAMLTGLGASVIELGPHLNSADIVTFIDIELENNAHAWTEAARQSIRQSLVENADGMFLWVTLMLEYLRSASNNSELFRCLEDLPEGLEAVYSLLVNRLYNRLSRNQKHLVQTLFAIMSTSGRPLTHDELSSACSIALRVQAGETRKDLDNSLTLNPSDIIKITGGLVTFQDARFHMIHNSARDFLTREVGSPPNAAKSDEARYFFKVDLEKCHDMMGEVCLQLFQDNTQIEFFGVSSADQHMRLPNPLINYASLYAVFHLSNCGKEGAELRAAFERLLGSPEYMRSFEDLTSNDTIESELQHACVGAGLNAWWLMWSTVGDLETPDDQDNNNMAPAKEQKIESPPPYYDSQRPFVDEPNEIQSLRRPALVSDAEPPIGSLSVYDGEVMDVPARSQKLKSPTEAVVTAPRVSKRAEIPMLSQSISQSFLTPSNRAQIRLEEAKNYNIIPSGYHFGFLFNLTRRFLVGKHLLTPLELLWQRILEAAPSMPPLVLTSITVYYTRLNKLDQALEIGTRCSEKLGDADSILRVIHESVMADLRWKRREFDVMLTHLKEVQTRLTKPTRQVVSTYYTDHILMIMAECYRNLGQYDRALEVLGPIKEDRVEVLDKTYGKMRLLWCLGKSAWHSGRLSEAIKHFARYREVYQRRGPYSGLTWNEYPNNEYIKSLYISIRCLFELSRDEEALHFIERLKSIRQSLSPTADHGEQEYLDSFVEEISALQKIIQIDNVERTTPVLQRTIERDCLTHGTEACLGSIEDWTQVMYSVFDDWKHSSLRGQDFFQMYFKTYGKAHTSLSAFGHTNRHGDADTYAWHMSAHYFQESSMWEELDNRWDASESLWRYLDSFEKYYTIQSRQDGLSNTPRRISTAIYNISVDLGLIGLAVGVQVSTFAARVVSHIDGLATPKLLTPHELDMTRYRVIESCEESWEFGGLATKPREEAQDRIEKLKNIQRRHLDQFELRKLYVLTEALLLPESWEVVKKTFLEGRPSWIHGQYLELV